MSNEPLDLVRLVGQEDRDLLVTALQALWRERVAARKSVAAVSQLSPHAQNSFDLILNSDAVFGIHEAAQMLRRVGAAPLA